MNNDLKPMPLASVIYAVTFDEHGVPTVQAKIHADVAGLMQFEGDPVKSYTLLTLALECVGKRLAANVSMLVTQAAEEKRLLQKELPQPPIDNTAATQGGPPNQA